jgi:hypothetical protein
MNAYLRIAFGAGALLLVLIGLGFATTAGWATDLWAWPDGRLSFSFIGSMLAAAGAGLAWIVLVNDPAMFQPFALDAVVVSVAGAVLDGSLYATRGEGQLLRGAIVGIVAAIVSLGLYLWSRSFSARDPRPTPTLVRLSYAVFVVALSIAGVALLARVDHIFPWTLKPETSIFIGSVLLGSALYYGYGIVRPSWAYAGPQLLAFLVYDIVLALPLVGLLSTVADADRPSLSIYLAVVGYSGLLAIFYVFVNPATRIRGQRMTPAAEARAAHGA